MKMIKREGKGPPPRDLLVCFPTRAHLTLMPKPASSPRRLLRNQQKQLRRSMRGSSMGGGHASSPHLWSGTKQMGSENLSEPTSPKVTCAGQIKVRPNTRSCKNWQTVMEEIERLHIDRKKKSTWVETLGFKKEVMHFLTCLRKLKFDFHCLGSFSHVDITSDDEEEEEEEDDNHDKEIKQDQNQDHHDHENDEELSSHTVFSKWFMVLQENNNQECAVFEDTDKSLKLHETENLPSMPPTNALLLMRCRSAPAKSWMEEKEEEEEQQQQQQEQEKDDNNHDHNSDDYHDFKEEEHEDKDDHLEKKASKRNSLMELMKNETDFYKLSIDIAKETWVIGGIQKDPLSRSRSWKR